MSEQALDLKRSMHIVRRHWVAVVACVGIGIVLGAWYTVLRPPMYASSALVVLPTNIKDTASQAVIADSPDVLAGALRHDVSGISLPTLRKRVKVAVLTSNILSFEAVAKTASQAESAANEVARSYVSLITSKATAASVGGQVDASLLQRAVTATRTPVPVRLATTAGLGGLIGLLLGTVGVLAFNRGDRRLRHRDEMADTIGSPVLASLPVWAPKDPAAWISLLEKYQPDVVHAWRMRNALRYLGVFDRVPANGRRGAGYSVTVLTLSTDRRALALGPQLAVFAASVGLNTALVIGPQQDPAVTATLRAACAGQTAASKKACRVRVVVADQAGVTSPPDAEFVVVVAVADSRVPHTTGMLRTNMTVLGVSAGAATAEQLARAAAVAAADGRQIEGILVADPDATDHTTGRLPQVARPAHRGMPARMTSMVTETKG